MGFRIYAIIIEKRRDIVPDILEVCGGCNAKLGPDLLHKALCGLPNLHREEVLVGYDTADDAAIIKLSEDVAVILTMDFFPVIVENPYDFGRIAAVNALSDVYAMGGEPVSALNLVCFPESGDTELLREILRGGADAVVEAGAALVGGHSIHDPRTKYGLSVMGKVHPDKVWKNNSPKAGDALILTKKLGVSLVTGGVRAGVLPSQALEEAVASMGKLNKDAAEILKGHRVHACTDVTGFGLAGHLLEMLGESKNAILYRESLPLLSHALQAAKEFCFTSGAQRNRNHAQSHLNMEDIPFAYQEILFDPQTSGGLLVAVPVEEAEEILAEMHVKGLPAALIGNVIEGEGKIRVL